MIVRLDSVTRNSGNTKEDEERIGLQFRLIHAIVGASAILIYFGEEDKALQTSKVEEVGIFEHSIKIKTRNTEYMFEILN